VTVVVPDAVGVKLTEQEPPARVQVVGLKLPPEPVLEKATIPEGVVGFAPVSATVAVQLEGEPIVPGLSHEMAVFVGRMYEKLALSVPDPVIATVVELAPELATVMLPLLVQLVKTYPWAGMAIAGYPPGA